MHDYYKCNQNFILDIMPKKYYNIAVIIWIMCLGFIIFSFFYKVSDTIETKLQVKCEKNICKYYISANLSNIAKIKNSHTILINKKIYLYKIKQISELQYDNNVNQNYQIINLDLKLAKKYQKNNLYLDVKIKLKEEKLIKKIQKIIF